MAAKKPRTPHIAALPGKAWVYRASVGLLATSAVALIIMSKTGNPAAAALRGQIGDALVPVLSVVSSPMQAVGNAGQWIGDMVRLRAENVALKNQNIQLLQWQALAKEMEEENRALRSLAHMVSAQKSRYITARIVSDFSGPYVHSALINAGVEDGVRKDQPVISGDGLIGRVVDTGHGSARVLLLSDINSRVPVIAEHSRERSILVGNKDGTLSLSYLFAGHTVEVGERIVTSGDGGIFPPGLPVGMVTSVDNGVINVQPFSNAPHVDYVSVIDYNL